MKFDMPLNKETKQSVPQKACDSYVLSCGLSSIQALGCLQCLLLPSGHPSK